MTKYVLAYSGDIGEMPAEQAEVDQVMAAWGAWMEQLGESLVDGGNPFGHANTISKGSEATDGGVGALTGYGIISADDMDAAVEAARGCPIIEAGGTVSVYEVFEM